MSINSTIAEWAEWKAPAGVLPGRWTHKWTSDAVADHRIVPWVHESGIEMDPQEYARLTCWKNPVNGSLSEYPPQYDTDIIPWHSTLFLLIEERDKWQIFTEELLNEVASKHCLALLRRGGGMISALANSLESHWLATKATPAQLAEALAKVIKETE